MRNNTKEKQHMMPIVDVFVSTIIQALLQQLFSISAVELAGQSNIIRHLSDLIQTLRYIQFIIEVVEKKQLTNESLKVWFDDLKVLIYDLDDQLDELTSGIKRTAGNFFNKNIGGFFSNHKLISKIRDLGKLDVEAQLTRICTLKEYDEGSANRSLFIRDATSFLVHESYVFGMDEQKREIMELLLENSTCGHVPLVISIIGMGGVGKTTLAQLVYNDENVRESFELRVWVCVSDEFDSIIQKIYEAIGNGSKPSAYLRRGVVDALTDKKYLIVLDDVWDEDAKKWDELMVTLKFGAPGSRVVVTTCSHGVVDKIGYGAIVFHMSLLSDEACAGLLAQRARRSFLDHTELKDVGMELVHECRGLPLVANILGLLLRSLGTKEEWESILHTDIWNREKETSILPVLMSSYRHLRPHLKPLFVFCSIFPKGYEFVEKELIYYWMGQGLLEDQDGRRRTRVEVGHAYVKELIARSLFQHSGGSKLVMHDLIHDLSRSVAQGTCCHFDGNLPKNIRHCSFSPDANVGLERIEAFYEVKGLRTLLQLGSNHSRLSSKEFSRLVRRQRRLRLLSLKGNMDITKLPDSIFKLIHLRYLTLCDSGISALPASICNLVDLCYLNLSSSPIVELPDSIGDLIRLCYIDLSHTRIIRLPDSVGKLIDLVYLSLSHTPIATLPTSMGGLLHLETLGLVGADELEGIPVEIGRLTKLQELPQVVLGKGGDCFGLKELEGLNLLQGRLKIVQLQNVVDIQGENAACLRFKGNIDDLSLEWGTTADVPLQATITHTPEDVIDCLQPHENMRELSVLGYRGSVFPRWIADGSYNKLSRIVISRCFECTRLPSLGLLPNLEELIIEYMTKIRFIGTEFSGFPKLLRLRFFDMPELEEWNAYPHDDDDAAQIDFPLLQELEIRRCPKLITFGSISFHLKHLILEDCSALESLPKNMSDVVKLHVSRCPSLRLYPNLKDLSVHQ